MVKVTIGIMGSEVPGGGAIPAPALIVGIKEPVVRAAGGVQTAPLPTIQICNPFWAPSQWSTSLVQALTLLRLRLSSASAPPELELSVPPH